MKTINLNKKISNNNFVVNFRNLPVDDFSAFAEGYHLAAKNLSESLLKKHNFPDFEGYPIVFLYRHSMELYLKFLIYKSATLINYKKMVYLKIKFENSHELVYLSLLAKNFLTKLFPKDKKLKNVLEEIEEVCRQFELIDKSSFSFRYPIDTKGNFASKEHEIINIDSMYNTMEKYLNILETIQFGLDIENDNIYYLIEELNKAIKE